MEHLERRRRVGPARLFEHLSCRRQQRRDRRVGGRLAWRHWRMQKVVLRVQREHLRRGRADVDSVEEALQSEAWKAVEHLSLAGTGADSVAGTNRFNVLIVLIMKIL